MRHHHGEAVSRFCFLLHGASGPSASDNLARVVLALTNSALAASIRNNRSSGKSSKVKETLFSRLKPS